MKAIVEETMRQGALGLSTGLVYLPANYAETEEVIELVKVAARYGGIYVSHMRNETTGVLESVAEVIRIADEAGIPGSNQPPQNGGATAVGLERTDVGDDRLGTGGAWPPVSDPL